MSKLLANAKEIVVPGEVLAEGMDYLPGAGTYRTGENIRASRLGLLVVEGRALKLVSLSGRYLPKKNDVIIGKVIDVTLGGWRFDINSAYSAMLPIKDASSEYIAKWADLTQYFNLGDYLVAKITQVSSQKLVDLTMKGPGLKKLNDGRLIKVNPYKVPRIIGKQGSMVSMIKNSTKCKIVVGQNGLIWLCGEPKMEVVAIELIKKIERESHISGLTEKIKRYIEKNYAELAANAGTDQQSGSDDDASFQGDEQ